MVLPAPVCPTMAVVVPASTYINAKTAFGFHSIPFQPGAANA